MVKDRVTVSIGLIYVALIILQMITLFFPYTYGIWNSISMDYEYYTTFFLFSSSLWMFLILGAILLIPCFILNLIFIVTTKTTTGGKAGFGIGAGAWAFFVLGYLNAYLNPDYLSVTTYVLILSMALTVCLIIFGILLFTRVLKVKSHIDKEALASLSTPSPEATPHLRSSSADYLVGPPCPECNKATKYIAQYDRYYCPDCEKYLKS